MKNYLLILIAVVFASCKGCESSHLERKEGVLRVCPKCTFVESQNEYYATDTSKQPNIIYKVRFKAGGIWYKASDVDDLIRVN